MAYKEITITKEMLEAGMLELYWVADWEAAYEAHGSPDQLMANVYRAMRILEPEAERVSLKPRIRQAKLRP